jgi:DNA repair exonuclease SbcCD ATPase subunit
VQEMKTLQKEWRAIGFVPRKLDNKLWSEFSEVHKTFFDRIKSGYQHLNEEQEALKKEKQEQIDKISATAFSEDPEQLLTELAALWEQWNSTEKVGGQTEMEMNKQFTSTLSKAISKLKLDKSTLKEVQLKLDTQLLQNDPNKLQKELNEVKATLDKLNNERTQLENNLEFFSDSSAENPLYKNVEKQINSCQKKIDKAKEEYIRLKQIKNAQTKLANQENEQGNESSEEDLESTTE